MVSTLGVAVVELAFGLCLGAIEVSVGPMVSVILAFIWLFLAAASLAVIGSGRAEGIGELLMLETGQSFLANLNAKYDT